MDANENESLRCSGTGVADWERLGGRMVTVAVQTVLLFALRASDRNHVYPPFPPPSWAGPAQHVATENSNPVVMHVLL
jgi:hypothetical protein